MGQVQFVGSLMLIALFTIALISFAINFGYDNEAGVNLASDEDFPGVRNSIQNNVSVFYTDVNTSSTAMYQSTVNTQSDSTEGGVAFKVGPSTALGMTVSAITNGYKKIFGSDSGFGIFLTALISILTFIIAMYIWKTWRGNPD